MKLLRHPIRAIREPFGTAGLIVACVALIAALAGGAYAASNGLTSQQKKEVKKIAKSFQGTGPQGAAGAPGAAGANGKDGAAGANGKDGTSGANGVSPTGTAFSGNANGCQEGGVKFTGANTTVACNGVKGTNGTNGKSVEVGSPTEAECADGGATVQVAGEPASKKAVCNGANGFTEALPEGRTEIGGFVVDAPFIPSSGFQEILTGIYFPVPLANALESNKTHVIAKNPETNEFEEYKGNDPETLQPVFVPSTVCLGTLTAPTAPSGNLCVYVANSNFKLQFGEFVAPVPGPKVLKIDQATSGASKVGALLGFASAGNSGPASSNGTWAVTG